jgi:hypothetical protein
MDKTYQQHLQTAQAPYPYMGLFSWISEIIFFPLISPFLFKPEKE